MTGITDKQRKKAEKAAKRQARIDAMNAKMDARIERSKQRTAEHEKRIQEIKEESAVRKEKLAAADAARKAEFKAANEAVKIKYQSRKTKVENPFKHMARLGLHLVSDGYYTHGRRKLPIAGATAEYDSGAEKKRTTGTRVITGTVLFGPVGAVAGGLLKKNKSKCYVTITFADGNTVIIESPIADEAKARKFVAKVNAASAYYADQV